MYLLSYLFLRFKRSKHLGHWYKVGERVLASSRVCTFEGLQFILVEGNSHRVGGALNMNSECVCIDAEVDQIPDLASSLERFPSVSTESQCWEGQSRKNRRKSLGHPVQYQLMKLVQYQYRYNTTVVGLLV